MIGQGHAIGPADGNVFALQGADDLVEQGVAAPHQDQHVAIARWARLAIAAEHRLTATDHGLDLARDAAGELPWRAFRRILIDRRPGVGLRRIVPHLQGPDVDGAATGGTDGLVPDRLS